MAIFRSIIFLLTFYPVVTVLCLIYIPLVILPRKYFAPLAVVWVKIVMWVAQKSSGITYELRGEEYRPITAVIYACKHQSAWETLMFNLIVNDCAYVMKKELLRLPLFGWYLTKMGNISVDRAAGSKALRYMIEQAQAVLSDSRNIVIFPQGTRTETGDMDSPYLPGVAGLYAKANVAVVPVALNSGIFWPKGKFIKYSGVITVEFLKPIPAGLHRKEFITRLKATIEPATKLLEAEATKKFFE